MKKSTSILLFLVLVTSTTFSQNRKKNPAYLDMMYDLSINFHTVCDSAEAYFKTIDKDKKGSGYKPFMRWRHLNEGKYGISGNRMSNYNLPFKEYERLNSQVKANKNGSKTSSATYSISGWIDDGPYQLGAITGHQTPGLGRLEYVKVNPANKNQIYIGSRSSGLWRTNDEGASWSNNSQNLPAGGVNCFDTNPSNFNEILFNVQSGDLHISFGIYRSTDGGTTITQSAFNPTNLGMGGIGSGFQIYIIKYHPLVPNLVFISTSNGLYKSTDNLATYSLVNASYRMRDIEFHPTNSTIIYGYNSTGSFKNKIFKSTDTGATFTALNDLPANNENAINITTLLSNPTDIYLVSSGAGIYKSTNEGASFNLITTPLTGISFSDGIPNDTNPSVYLSGYVDLFKSTDGGTTFSQSAWYDLSNAAHGPGSNQVSFNNSQVYVHADTNYKTCVNGIFYACTDGFLCKSEDNGTTWDILTNSISLRENYCLGVNQSNAKHTILGSQDNGTSLKNDNGWYEVKGSDGAESLSFPLNENNLIFSTQEGGRFRSYNLGNSISNIKPILDPGETSAWIAPLLMDPNDHYTLYSFHKNIYKSTNFGTSWVKLGSSSPLGSYHIREAAIAENNSNKIVVASLNTIALSNDGGITFTSILNNLPSNLFISDVTFDPANDNTILVTYADVSSGFGANKVFISTNSGASWTNITYNLGFMPVLNVIVAFDKIYVGTEIGIYYKGLTETTWIPFNTNLPAVPVNELEVNYGANEIKAATWGRGLFSNKIPERENFPSIVKTVISSPVVNDAPKTSVEQFVTSTINYSGTLTNVYVSWAIGNTNFNATNIIPMSLQSGNIWKSNASLPFNEPVGTRIYFKVTAVGSASDISETYKFMYEIKPFEYCAASGNTTTDWYIRRFELSNLDNNINTNTTYNYYNTTPIILFKGDTYTAKTQFRYASNGNGYHVWLDYNKDASFDTTEKIITDLSIPNGFDNSSIKTFTVPADSPTVTTRLRARYSYWTNDNEPCLVNTSGEVEDYLVKIIDKPTITFSGNQSYCVGDNVELTYTGSTVEALNWELSNGINTFTFSGNSINTTTLPIGDYATTLLYTVEGVQFRELFSSAFKVLPTPTPVIIANDNESICPNSIKTLTATGGNTTGNKVSKLSGTTNLSIPDNNLTTGVSQVLTISNLASNATITKVEVIMNITHPWLKDLRINLEAPNGKIINLYNQHGDSGDNLTNTVITSDSSAPAFANVASAAPFSGTFKAALANQTTISTTPAVNSTLFSDLFSIANGDWKVWIYDDGNGDLGTLLNCSIVLTYNSQDIRWSPTTNLFTTPECTIGSEYTGTFTNIVYAKPSQTTTYIASAEPTNCSISDSVTFTINSIPNKYSAGNWTNGIPPTTNGLSSIEFDDPSGFISSSDISGCSCTVTSGNVVISSGTNLKIDGAVTINGGSLTVSNNANLIQRQDVANVGSITSVRDTNPLKRFDYTMWSSPVSGLQSLQQFSPNTVSNRFYNYITSSNLYAAIANPSSVLFEKAKGHLIRIPFDHPTTPTIWTGQFTGVPNNGLIENSLVYISDTQKFNMVGNPYPSTIDADELLTQNSSSIEGTLYFWRKTNNDLGTAYATYTLGGGTTTSPTSPTPNGIIQVGQGFIVAAKNTTNPKITFTNALRVTENSNQFFKTSTNTSIEKHRYWLNLTNANGLFSQLMVGYIQGTTLGVDDGFDGKNINDAPLSLTSLIASQEYTIQARPLPFLQTDSVPLHFKTNTAGNFTIAINTTDGLFSLGQQLFLKDNLLQIVHNLSLSQYEFYSDIGNFSTRFEVIYQNSLNNDEYTSNAISIYPNPTLSNSVLNVIGIKEEANYFIFDMNGRQIAKSILLDNKIHLNGIATGIYLLKINTNTGTISKKIIIK